MCGIAGYFGDKEISKDKTVDCLEQMKRRGPNARGTYLNCGNGKNLFLLHTRLSIIDVEARSNQPLDFDSNVIVYNGELYNFLELRNKLLQKGLNFVTDSDTEVFLKAHQFYGTEKALDLSEGMWAYALFDKSNGSLTLGRDRFGEKPLYYYLDNDGIYFGSEIKFIFTLLGKALAINFNQVNRYLVNGYKSLYKQKGTFFEGIQEVPPSTFLEISRDLHVREKKYWNPEFSFNHELSYEEAVKGVRDKLLQAMEIRLRADVPLAFCMSGGIDSLSLISIAKRIFNYDVHGFTIVDKDARYNEEQMVDLAVKELQVEHDYVKLSEDNFLHEIQTLVSQHDAPVYTISLFTHWKLMKSIACKDYSISVSGTGADELLSGYYDHHNLYLYELRDDPSFNNSLAGWKKHIAPIVRNPHLQNPKLYFENPEFREHIYFESSEFKKYLKNHEWDEGFNETDYSNDILRNRMLNELFHEGVPVILHEDDLNAMYYSLENRSPFLDRGLFEHCYSIPTNHLVRDGFAKVVLRDAMKDIVPHQILWNPRKVGFNANILSLLDLENKEFRNSLLNDSPIFEHVKKDKIELVLKKKEFPNSLSKFLFSFISCKAFIEAYS
jgi:asparagine synthase (glutamine-hydrolysing)